MKIKRESTEYRRDECVVFRKTTEQFGGLSNMAAGYPLHINGVKILTAEALYQACRFPHIPDVQKTIIGQASPMTAKMQSKPYRNDSRPDWDDLRVKIMWWCLRVKLAQNWEKFSQLLLSTGEKPIVEESRRDPFWGAKRVGKELLVGTNVLGQLLTLLRDLLCSPDAHKLLVVKPLPIPDFLFVEKPIGVIKSNGSLDSLCICEHKALSSAIASTDIQMVFPGVIAKEPQEPVEIFPSSLTASTHQKSLF